MSFNAGAKTSLLQYPTNNRICGDSTRRRMMMRSGLRPSKLPTDSARSLPNTSTQRPQTMPPSHGGSSYHEFNPDHPARTLERAAMAPKAASFGPPARHVQTSSSAMPAQRTNPQGDARTNQMYPLSTQSTERPVARQAPPTKPHPIHQKPMPPPLPIGRQRSEPIMVPKAGADATQSGASGVPPARKRDVAATTSLHNSAYAPPKKTEVYYDDDVIMMDAGDAGKNSLLDTENSSVDDWDDVSEPVSSFRDVNGIRERAKIIRTMSKQLHMPKAANVTVVPNVPAQAPQQPPRRNDMIPLLATRISTADHEYASDEEEF